MENILYIKKAEHYFQNYQKHNQDFTLRKEINKQKELLVED